MNIGNKARLPPSPSSTICRKPLLNITNLPSTEIIKNQKNFINRPESTKTLKTRVSIDQFSRPKLKQVHSKKSTRSDSQQSTDSANKEKERFCNNHRNRKAMHQINMDTCEYYCFECSLLYAKQGYKIKSIAASNYTSQKTNREKQTMQYLQKCSQMHGQIINWRKQLNKAIKQIFQEHGQLINDQKIKMEQQLSRIRQFYCHQIKLVEQTRQKKLELFKQSQKQIQNISKILESTKTDIQSNYEDCIKSFSSKQFRNIMDEYWKQIQNAQKYLKLSSITNIKQKLNTDIKMTVRTMERSDNTLNEFTFSKQKKFETPPFSKELRGIKIVQSQQDSNRYQSSEKQSIVDTKFNINDFNI